VRALRHQRIHHELQIPPSQSPIHHLITSAS
jgi:hypothetical protein